MVGRESDAAAIVASLVLPARFEAIFDRHYAAIHGYLVRRVGRDVADDLAADTFVEAFRARSRYDPARPDARPWLFGIAANLVRGQARHERRQLVAFSRTGVDPLVDDQEEISARLDAHRAVAHALAALAAKDRETLLLHTWAELSYEEIAIALDVPIGTVRSRLNRARRQVRELLVASGQLFTEQRDDGSEVERNG